MKLELVQHQKELVVNAVHSVCFEFCDEGYLPSQKQDAKQVIKALKSFLSVEALQSRNPHPLKSGSQNPKINTIMQTYKDLELISVDVGHRNGKNGNMRLLYYIDKVNPYIS
jgi:hypothetical protein